MKSVALGAVVALLVAIAAGPAWAQGGFGKTAKIEEEKQKEKTANKEIAGKETAGKRDPAAEAFALPKGVVLRPDQQEAFDKMKEEMHPKLVDAMGQVETATGADKNAAAKNVVALRKEIKTKIAQILQQPDLTAIRQAQEAVRAAMESRFQGRGPGAGPGRSRGRGRH